MSESKPDPVSGTGTDGVEAEAGSTPTVEAAPAKEEVELPRFFWLGIAGLGMGMFLAMLDSLIVATALPTIAGDLGGLDKLSWVITAYLLPTAVGTPIWGKLGDLLGRKRIFMVSIVVFLIGSALCGTAQDMTQLIIYRAVQGIGGGGLIAGALAIIGEVVPFEKSGRIQTMMAILMPSSFVGGPLIGGLFTEHISWHWVFYVNLPLGIAALVVIALFVHTSAPTTRARIDVPGALLLTATIVSLTLLTSWAGTEYAWSSPQIIGLAVLAVLSLIAFVRVEARVAEPILPPRMFRSRNFTLALVLTFTSGGAMFAGTSFLPQYTQFARGVSPTTGGLLLVPMMTAMFLTMVIGGKKTAKTQRYRPWALASGPLISAGMLCLLVLESDTNTFLGSLVPIAIGAGVGCLTQNTVMITMNNVESRDLGAGMASNTLGRIVGGSLVVALLGAVFGTVMKDTISDRLGDAVQAGGGKKLSPELVQQLPAPVQSAFADGVTDGLHAIAIGGVVLGLLTFAAAWFIREPNPQAVVPAPAPAPDAGATDAENAPLPQ
ncbi:MDR family MFS transporter [Kitasatospora sp. NPDC050463]|uniref:MDR family MFS transporter n=1 Tax=Kitasatospora sp. NPDC050463 TaxID=3155786 RepID=UPI00340F008B